MTQDTQTRNSVHSFVLLAGVGLGWIFSTISPVADAVADERSRNKVAFQSGSERSVMVLQQISKQIESLDKRLANIESAIVKPNAKAKK